MQTTMPTQVKCIFPDGSWSILPVGPTPTPQTFRLIAHNHIGANCTNLQLRYGTPPAYTVTALSGEWDDCPMKLEIKNQDTVWIEVCQSCRDTMKRRSNGLTPGHRCMGRNIYTLDDLNLKTSCFPTVCTETLSPNGYYYELVSSTLGLENFQVYTFTCLPDRFFLYQSSIKCLIEVPAKLIHLRGDEGVPEEFLAMEGFLCRIVNLCAFLKHMTFYTFPVLPGRLFVFDGGLNRLLETHTNSPLCTSLLGSIESELSNEQAGIDQLGLEISEQGVCTSERLPDSVSEVKVRSLGHYNFKFAAIQGFQTNATAMEEKLMKCSNNAAYSHKPDSPTVEPAAGCRTNRNGSNSNFQHTCTTFSFADIKVYKPHSLCVPLEKPTPEPHCSAPPCVYTGVNDDPR